MPKTVKATTPGNDISRLLLIAGTILVIFSAWLWFTKIYKSPEHVFWGMMSNSLTTTSVTRRVTQGSEAQTSSQEVRLRFGAQNATQSLQTQIQKGENGNQTVIQELISTPRTDYVRFARIQVERKSAEGNPVDYSQIEGIWGKTEDSESNDAPNYIQSVLGTVPFAHLDSYQRQRLIDTMKSKSVYSVDYSKVEKKIENEKQVYVYAVSIDPKAYFETLQEFAKVLGLTDVDGLDPTQYEGVEALNVVFTVDVNSRKLTKIHYTASEYDEIYENHGLTSSITIPTDTIPITELQKRIQDAE